MEIYQINALLSAILYAFGAAFSKQALSAGAGVMRLSFIVNLATAFVFSIMLLSDGGAVSWSGIIYPVAAGCCFFIAQIFTFAAIRFGDVSLQTPLMGSKAVFAVIIAIIAGTEQVSPAVIVSSMVTMLAVGLLGFSGTGKERVVLSISLALLSSLVFAVSDTLVGVFASDYGVSGFLFVLMSVNAVLSLGLIPFFNEPFSAIPRRAWPWMGGAALMLACQALLLNYTFGRYQQVAEMNIIFSTRGLFSVILAALAALLISKDKMAFNKSVFGMRLTGALMICGAIAILFYPTGS